MAGVTFSTPGNWTSWPPHEHSQLLEEAYLYIDMPAPSFGVQFVYTDPKQSGTCAGRARRRLCTDAQGYHPNVAALAVKLTFYG
jgi:5-deoxy-glucuronate isomerase